MNNTLFKVDKFVNEPILDYHVPSAARDELMAEIKRMRAGEVEIPVIIGGKEIKTGKTAKCVIPHDKNTSIGFYHMAGEAEVKMAIDAAMAAKDSWMKMSYEQRILIFLKAAKLAATTWRPLLNGATVLSQSKTFQQAEIDAACELIDFFNSNCKALSDLYQMQPMNSFDAVNIVDYRPLDGFVYAVTPFNFTAIAGNLVSAPAVAGNTVVWKPASVSVYSSYIIFKLLKACGLPDGVINFIPGSASMISDIVLSNEHLAGVHFTGSTEVFSSLWTTVGNNISKYHTYPRLVGETGGKNFSVIHNSADIEEVTAALIRGAYEYQGQKCSATSRAYVPQSIWPALKTKLLSEMSTITMGSAEDVNNFVSAVIDQKAFNKIKGYIDHAASSDKAEIIAGGKCDDSVGYFIEPTVIVTTDPYFKTMVEEIFGPVLTIYVYEDEKIYDIAKICADTSPYALTGSIWATDREMITKLSDILMGAAGNLYVNDKSTGSVVGQNPFGGSKASGTNDKAGTMFNMLKWVSPRNIKENFIPTKSYKYTK